MVFLAPMIFAAVIITAVLVILALWLIPKWQVRSQSLEPKDRIDLEIKARAVLAQLVVGSLLLLTFWATWNSIELSRHGIEISRNSMELARRSLDVDRRSRFAGRFASAVEMLGSAEADVNATVPRRLGGIYALERLANESEFDYEPAVQVLAGYVRSRTLLTDTAARSVKQLSPPPDVQAALTVISRRKHRFEDGESFSLDLSRSDLRGIRMVGADLNGSFFYQSNLAHAVLVGTRFGTANLSDCLFQGAFLQGADLRKADLAGAVFKGAYCDSKTRWPQGMKPDEHGVITVELP